MAQIKNPEKFECDTCSNTFLFNLVDLDRIGDAQEFDVLIQCEFCRSAVNYRFTGFALIDKLVRHVKFMIGDQKTTQRPSSYEEWDLRTGKVIRTTHPSGLWEDLSDGYNRQNS